MPASADEQYLLELINEARLDPVANANRYITSYSALTSPDPDVQSSLRYFSVDGNLLQSQIRSLKSVAPVAWNDSLATSALGHNSQMIARDTQAHEGIGDGDPGTRATDQGYSFSVLGENIYAYSYNALYAHAGFMVDWGGSAATGGMQDPAGHRENIMDGDFREVGVGITSENNPLTEVGPELATQDFGTRYGGPAVFVLGVAYNDSDRDDFYSVGEGVRNLKVTLGGGSVFSSAAGGYTLQSNDTGKQTISFSGGGLSDRVDAIVTLKAGMNVKFDVIDGDTLHTSVSAKISGPVSTIEGLGTHGLKLAAGAGAQELVGTDGGDKLKGGAGADTLHGGFGKDKLVGGSGADTFVFDTRLCSANVDKISHFSVTQGDTIALAHDIFTTIDTGTLGGAAFHKGKAAHDASDRVIYNGHDGKLFYDADGKGGTHAVLVATLDKHLNLDHTDFLIV